MYIKSFQRQVQRIFSRAAYKSSGLHISCLSTTLPQSPLSFKIDISQRLYREYELSNFKFCEKGTTPRSIAQEIAIFTYQNPHYSFEIDSLGSITVSPTPLFYKEMKESILDSGNIRHTLLFHKPEHFQIHNQNEECCLFYRIEDLSLSSLRLVKQLQLYAKTKLKLKQLPNSKIRKIIDLTSVSLTQQQVKTILSHQIIDTLNFSTHFLLPKNTKKNLHFLIERNNSHIINKWQRKPNQTLVTASIRHKYIQFLAHTKHIVDQNNDVIIKVGQVFPHITLQSLQSIHSFPNDHISKIMSYCMQVDSILPITLSDPYVKPHFPLTSIKQSLTGRTSSETILLLLQSISLGKVAQSLEFLSQEKAKKLFVNEPQIYKIMTKNLQQLLF